jgi:hypothetical protein
MSQYHICSLYLFSEYYTKPSITKKVRCKSKYKKTYNIDIYHFEIINHTYLILFFVWVFLFVVFFFVRYTIDHIYLLYATVRKIILLIKIYFFDLLFIEKRTIIHQRIVILMAKFVMNKVPTRLHSN